MAAVWALPNAPLQSAITNNQPFCTADQVCDLISQMVPFGSQLKQGLSAALPILLSTIIIMAPVPESVMRKVNAVIVPSNERMEYTPDGRPCVHFPTMLHRIKLLAQTPGSSPTDPSPIPTTATHQPCLVPPNQAILPSSSVPSSSHTTHPLSSSGPQIQLLPYKWSSHLPGVPTPISTPKPKTRPNARTPPTPFHGLNNNLHVPQVGNVLSKRRRVGRIYPHCQPH